MKELCRVLKPAGKFISCECFLSQDNFEKIPEKKLKRIAEEFPGAFNDCHRESIGAGFSIVEEKIINTWTNEKDDSQIASLCRELNVVLEYKTILRILMKN
jgi:hypothetical protein